MDNGKTRKETAPIMNGQEKESATGDKAKETPKGRKILKTIPQPSLNFYILKAKMSGVTPRIGGGTGGDGGSGFVQLGGAEEGTSGTATKEKPVRKPADILWEKVEKLREARAKRNQLESSNKNTAAATNGTAAGTSNAPTAGMTLRELKDNLEPKMRTQRQESYKRRCERWLQEQCEQQTHKRRKIDNNNKKDDGEGTTSAAAAAVDCDDDDDVDKEQTPPARPLVDYDDGSGSGGYDDEHQAHTNEWNPEADPDQQGEEIYDAGDNGGTPSLFAPDGGECGGGLFSESPHVDDDDDGPRGLFEHANSDDGQEDGESPNTFFDDEKGKGKHSRVFFERDADADEDGYEGDDDAEDHQESEADDGEEGDNDNDDDDGVDFQNPTPDDDAQRLYEGYYSDEEEEYLQKERERKKRAARDFFDDEAELSGEEDEWGDEDAADEDGGQDAWEEEEGDQDEVPDERELRDQIGRVHWKQMMDEDKRQLMRYKEAFVRNDDANAADRMRSRYRRDGRYGDDDEDEEDYDLMRNEHENGESDPEIDEYDDTDRQYYGRRDEYAGNHSSNRWRSEHYTPVSTDSDLFVDHHRYQNVGILNSQDQCFHDEIPNVAHTLLNRAAAPSAGDSSGRFRSNFHYYQQQQKPIVATGGGAFSGHFGGGGGASAVNNNDGSGEKRRPTRVDTPALFNAHPVRGAAFSSAAARNGTYFGYYPRGGN